MSRESAEKIIEQVLQMGEARESFEDETQEELAAAIRYLVKERSRREEVLALAAATMALEQYKQNVEKLIEYARLGGMKEREATLLELRDQIDKELQMAVSLKASQRDYRQDLVEKVKRAVLDYLEPTLGRGKWHAREEAAILKVIAKVVDDYLVVKRDD